MKPYLLSAALVIAVFTFGCSQSNTSSDSKPPVEEKKINVSVSQLATNTDLSCGMKFSSDGQIGDTMTYNGKLYGFCSKECRDNFAADPSKFVK